MGGPAYLQEGLNGIPVQAPSLRHWRLEADHDGTVWLALDKEAARANVLSVPVLDELELALDAASAYGPRGLVLFSGKPQGFIAGADIKEFTALAGETEVAALLERAHRVFDRLEALNYPTVCLIHGYCLGGGLELALACRYRVAQDDPRTFLGFPEVRLGLFPAFGGTVRAIRLIGMPSAMDMMISGRPVNARAGAELGLVDYAVPERYVVRAARELLQEAPPPRRAPRRLSLMNLPLVRPAAARYLRRRAGADVRPDHYPAPYALIDLWRRWGDRPREMLVQERRAVAALLNGPTARNLLRVFALQERLKSLGPRAGDPIERVHVIGGGVMGGDIAAWCALQGLRVTVQERDRGVMASAMQRARALFCERLTDPRSVQEAVDRLAPDESGDGLRRADVVIEAIFEDVEAKRSLYRDVEPRLKAGALLATNTFSIPLEELNGALSRPERLVGLHFFNPVPRMQLIEVVSGPGTDPAAAARAAGLVRRIDRLPLPVKSKPGFLVNRVLMPYMLEAVVMAEEGVPAEAIDGAAEDFGMPMGPLLLADTVGLDVCLSAGDILAEHLDVVVPERLRRMIVQGRLGRKTGHGFYDYREGRPLRATLERGYTPPADLLPRLMFRLFNECMACRHEGVVADDDLIDAGVIFGSGFAPFRGGPMHYLREEGMAAQLTRLEDLAQRYGHRFAPHPGWGEAGKPQG